MVDRDEAIDIDRLDHWQPASAPAAFADRVVAEWARERAAIGRGPARSRRWVAVIALLVVGALSWALTRDRVVGMRGSLIASTRESVELGERATIVADAGAELDWRVEPDGRAAIEQRAGRVFYRVDEGEAFEVATAAGTVRVTGTCFEVEVEPMRRRSAALAGTAVAALSAGIVVAVYEGGVVVAHDGVEIAAGPGERIVSDGERGMRRVVADDLDGVRAGAGEPAARVRSQQLELDELRARASTDEAEIERLRARVESLGGAPDDDAPMTRAHRCATNLPGAPGCPVLDPDAETLREMARCGSLRGDDPPFVADAGASTRPSQAWIADAELTAAEVDALTEAGERLRREHHEALVDLYAEAGGTSELDAGLQPWVLDNMIGDLIDPAERDRASRRLASERAGLVAPTTDPSALSLADRLVREMFDVGNRYERVVADVIGPDRAHALRVLDDGWGGAWGAVGECEDE